MIHQVVAATGRTDFTVEIEFDDGERTEVNLTEFVATGELNLKGHRKPVDVPFTWSNSGDVAEMRGELTVDRTEFDIGSGEWSDDESIGTDVRISFIVLLTRR